MSDILEDVKAKMGPLREISTLSAKILAGGLTALIFGLDYQLPGDFNSAIFYVCAVVVSAWAESTRWLWGITTLGAILAITHTAIPLGNEPIGHHVLNWVDLTNRYISAGMLVVTAGFVQIGMRLRTQLDANERLLEEISAREHAEEALRERDHRIGRLVDSAIIGIFFWDASGEITEANETFLQIVGYSRDELLSRHIKLIDLAAPGSWAAHLRAIEELVRTGKSAPFETEYIRRNGDRIPVLLGETCFGCSSGEGAAFVLALSERNRAREKLRQVQGDFAHAARISMLGEFTASIAHELGQPLTAIATNCGAGLSWLNRPAPNIEKASEAMKRAVTDVGRCSEILGGIRRMATSRAPERTRVSIDQIVHEAISFIQIEATSHAITVQTAFASGAPIVFVDRVQLQQVIVNLSINALQVIEKTKSPERRITIRTTISHPATTVCCAVEDSGPGIAQAHMDSLFKSFFTTKEGGMGMGLRISRTIIESHGGYIVADNESVHGGARLHFTLPLANSDG